MASINCGAHPLVMDALAEMSEAQMQMRLTHLPVRAQYPRRRKRGDGGDAPREKMRVPSGRLELPRSG